MTTLYWLFEDNGESCPAIAGVYASLEAAKAAGEAFEAERDYFESFVLEVTDNVPGDAHYHLRRSRAPGRRGSVPWTVSSDWHVGVVK